MTSVSNDPGTQRASRGRFPRPSIKTWFVLVLIAVFAFYTQQAFGMEWRTQAGRIGPGYFPRIIGIVAIVILFIVLIADLRNDVRGAEADDDREDTGVRHTSVLAVYIGICIVFVTFFALLGAIVASILFLLASLWMLDPEHRIRGTIVAVFAPIGLYLLLDVGLNAGLPSGLLTFL